MEIQISSGQGPAECELAVGMLCQALTEEFPDIQVLERIPGVKADCFRSVRLGCKDNLASLEGSIKWICQSPYRPTHKRKNWFVDVSILHSPNLQDFEKGLVRFETFRSSGKGGQHVNKVETGVRAIYLPTGLSVTSTAGRSQHMNKQIALNHLCQAIAQQNEKNKAAVKSLNWLEHIRLERGNPVRIYQGLQFTRIK